MVRYCFDSYSSPTMRVGTVRPPGAMAWQISIVPIRRQEGDASRVCPALWCVPRTYIPFDLQKLEQDVEAAARSLAGGPQHEVVAQRLGIRTPADLFARWCPVPEADPSPEPFLDAEIVIYSDPPVLPDEYAVGYVRPGAPGFDPTPAVEHLARWFEGSVVAGTGEIARQKLGDILSRQPWWFLSRRLRENLPLAYPSVAGMTPITAALVAQAFVRGRVDHDRRRAKKVKKEPATGRGERLGIPHAADQRRLLVHALLQELREHVWDAPDRKTGARRLVNFAEWILCGTEGDLDASLDTRIEALSKTEKTLDSRGARALLIPIDEWAFDAPAHVRLPRSAGSPDRAVGDIGIDASYLAAVDVDPGRIHHAVAREVRREGRMAALAAIVDGCGAVGARRPARAEREAP